MPKSVSNQPPHMGPNYLFFLLLSLVFMLLVVPLFETYKVGRLLMHAGLTTVLVSALVITSRRRSLLAIGMLIVAVAAPLSWITMLFDQPWLFVVSCVLESVFFVVMAGLIIRAVLRRHLATLNSVFGAISAYLLLGLAWSMLYMALERVDDESLLIANRTTIEGRDITALSQLIYFSFVTMSTLGYGDIIPGTPLARALTWMQSVTGLFYVAVLVAWIVSEIDVPRRNERDDTGVS